MSAAAQYRTVVADPPWPFKWQGGAGGRRRSRTTLGYPTMDYGEIEDLFTETSGLHLDLIADDATLFLWVTQEALHTGAAWGVLDRWGFTSRVGEWVWRKPNFGTGAYPRIGHETCLIYKSGHGSLRPEAPRNVHSVQTWTQPRTPNNGGKTHSAKPDAFYDHVEQGYEGPYLELFARRARFGWDYWGDESLGTAEVPDRQPAQEAA